MKKFSKAWRWILSVIVVNVFLIMPVHAVEMISTDVAQASSGNVLLGLQGTYITQVQDALALINAYRWEACTEGVENPSTGEPLTESDYVPIQWSADLEYIARIRAAESLLTMGHTRTNGDTCFALVSPNNISSYGEVLAWNFSSSMLLGIRQWYTEKNDWGKQTAGAVTGHYTQMIDPSHIYVGLGTFYSKSGSSYYNCTAGEFSGVTYYTHTSTPLSNPGEVIQLLEIPNSSITSCSIAGETSGQGTDVVTYTLTTNVTMNSGTVEMQIPSGIVWTSSNTSAGTISEDGRLSVTGCGQTVISAAWNGTNKSLTFMSNHIWDDGEITTEAGCTHTGVKIYTCKTCGDTREEAIPAVGHAWDEGTVTKEATCTAAGVLTYTCTNEHCNDPRATRTEDIPATGEHNWDEGEGIVTVEPTYTTTGVRAYTCTVCGKTKEEAIPKLKREGTTIESKEYNAVFLFTSSKQLQYVRPINKKRARVTIPASVKVDGKSYKVTSIAANALKGNKKVRSVEIGRNVKSIGTKAFYNCTKLKTVTIKSTKLKTGSIAKKAFSKINKNVSIKVPGSKLSVYKKLLKKGGLSGKASVVKG